MTASATAPDRSALIPLLERLPGTAIACVGDIMLDRFVSGTISRISPEAPIPVLRIAETAEMLGGVGNVARNLAALGCRGQVAGVTGDDAAGRTVHALLDGEAGMTASLVSDGGRPTSIKTRFIAGAQQMLRADEETTHPVETETETTVLEAAKSAIAASHVLVLSDYGKGVLTEGMIPNLIQAARAQGTPIIVDPKGTDFAKYRGATVITPNTAELEAATGLKARTDDQVVTAARQIMAEAGIEAVLATRSRDGMTLVTGGKDTASSVYHLGAEAREVFDVSGAGDTVVATLAAAMGAGASLPDAAALANVAAGIVVGKVGTAVATRDEISTMLRRQDLTDAGHKVLTLPQIEEQIAAWRRQGLKVGFTNGCFDLLHPGHVSLLSQARAACDRLIVALNSDSSVKRLKGDDRPVQNETARATVLASLANVDAVTLFTEDTPLTLIETLKPDVLIKGADYRLDQVIGADIVQAHGGRVVLADLTPGQSTTATIGRIEGGHD